MSVCDAGKWTALKLRAPLSPATLQFVVKELGFQAMAPVQAVTIPLLLDHKDVVVEAVTGSGKTLAYLVPAFEMLQRPALAQTIAANKRAVLAMVLLPTRELALQVYKIAKKYRDCVEQVAGLRVAIQCFIGGRPADVDERAYEEFGGNFLFCTPGRLHELMLHSEKLILRTLEFLVLDEGDRLLSMGFHAQLDTILSFLPKQRRTGLFSATQTKEVRELARAGLRNAQVVRVKVQTSQNATPSTPATPATAGEAATVAAQDMERPTIPSTLRNWYMSVPHSAKLDELVELLQTMKKTDKCIVYFLTCAAVTFFETALRHVVKRKAFQLYALHGQLRQDKRKSMLGQFSKRPGPSALLCTDVAARGLDFPDVSLIVQFEPPQDPATFIHRIGRTARMGKPGQSLVLLTPQELDYVPFMRLRNVHLMEQPPRRYTPPPQPAAQAEAESKAEDGEEGGDGSGDEAKPAEAKQEKAPLDPKAYRESKMCRSAAVLAVRRAALQDRAIVDAGLKACMAFVRAYKEHLCNAIFQLKRLDLVDLFHSYALLRVPKMPELKWRRRLRMYLQEEFMRVRLEDIPYKNPADEERRKRSEAKRKEKHLKKERLQDESIRGQMKKEMDSQKMGRRTAKKQWAQFEVEEIMEEARLIKKARNGRLSQAKLSRLLGESLHDGERPPKRPRLGGGGGGKKGSDNSPAT
eukprot:EG_transcript_4437